MYIFYVKRMRQKYYSITYIFVTSINYMELVRPPSEPPKITKFESRRTLT